MKIQLIKNVYIEFEPIDKLDTGTGKNYQISASQLSEVADRIFASQLRVQLSATTTADLRLLCSLAKSVAADAERFVL